MHPLANIAVSAARNGGKVIMRAMDRPSEFETTEKTRNDFVTAVDKAAEKAIIETIQKTHPEHSIMSEEMGDIEGNPDFQWIIDPLDGTANYIHGFPQFCISIAFKNKGQIEQGVIYDPVRNDLFVATKGEGARLNNRRIRVSDCTKMELALIGTGFPFRHRQLFPTYLKSLEEVYAKVSDIRRAGSAALDLAYVAAGKLDGHWELGLKIWDVAAGVLMIKEAGGMVSDLNGGETYLETGNILAGNPKIFKALLQTIQPIF